MKTRIRHFRKLRGLTQGELAARLETTAATVSRLETADMTVSTGWLERIAAALAVAPADLIDVPLPNRLVALGELGPGGLVVARAADEAATLTLETPARDPVLIAVACDLGPWQAGDMLLGDRLEDAGAGRAALGRDAIIAGGGEIGCGRLIAFEGDQCLLAPAEAGAPGRRLSRIEWVAPIVMLVRRFPPPG